MEIVIDGYNLMNVLPACRGAGGDWEEGRRRLLKRLENYQALNRHKITVVFDGWKNGWPMESAEKHGNIRVIYSRRGERADEVIKRMARHKKASLVVVTSDRGIVDHVVRSGAETMASGEFGQRMEMAAYMALEAGGGEEYDESLDRPITTKKKGNPCRLSRKERRRRQRLKKI